MSKTISGFFSRIWVKIDLYTIGALLAIASVTSWKAAGEFGKMRRAIEGQWSYGMERESWLRAEIDNRGLKAPDVDAIRRQHQAAVFRDDSKLIANRSAKKDEKPVVE